MSLRRNGMRLFRVLPVSAAPGSPTQDVKAPYGEVQRISHAAELASDPGDDLHREAPQADSASLPR